MIRGAGKVARGSNYFLAEEYLNPNANSFAAGTWAADDGYQVTIPAKTAVGGRYVPIVDWCAVNFVVTGSGDVQAGIFWVDAEGPTMQPALIRRSYTSADGSDTIFMEFNNGFPLLRYQTNLPSTGDVLMVFANMNGNAIQGTGATGPIMVGTGAELCYFQVGYHYEELSALQNSYGLR